MSTLMFRSRGNFDYAAGLPTPSTITLAPNVPIYPNDAFTFSSPVSRAVMMDEPDQKPADQPGVESRSDASPELQHQADMDEASKNEKNQRDGENEKKKDDAARTTRDPNRSAQKDTDTLAKDSIAQKSGQKRRVSNADQIPATGVRTGDMLIYLGGDLGLHANWLWRAHSLPEHSRVILLGERNIAFAGG